MKYIFTIIFLCIPTWICIQPISSYCIEENKNVNLNTIRVLVTMYNPEESQTDDTPDITASGAKINIEKASEHRWIAVSRDLLKKHKGFLEFGDSVYLINAKHKSGKYYVQDIMNKRWKKRIDILETIGVDKYKMKNVILVKL